MTFQSAVKSRVIAHICSDGRAKRRRHKYVKRSTTHGQALVVDYFHDVSDPYAYLVAQAIPLLLERFDVELRPHLISGPPNWAIPERNTYTSYAYHDACVLAESAGIDVPACQLPLSDTDVNAAQAMIAASGQAGFIETSLLVGEALWRGRALPSLPVKNAAPFLSAGDDALAKKGHYLGGTLHFAGEWYWGLDRLHYLERHLTDFGLAHTEKASSLIYSPPVVLERPQRESTGQRLEAFISFRSPYSAISFDRVRAIADRYGAEFVVRPVLPMVMRGLKVPHSKTMYILQDAAREARRLNVPFGQICDPLNTIKRAYALLPFAQREGRLADYCSSFLKGVWSEGIDAASQKGLSRIVERAGLDWSKARIALHSGEWKYDTNESRAALDEIGLWGVPSFRVGTTTTWGQDRLWRIEQALNGPSCDVEGPAGNHSKQAQS